MCKEDLFAMCNLKGLTVFSSVFNWTVTVSDKQKYGAQHAAETLTMCTVYRNVLTTLIHVRRHWTVHGYHFMFSTFCELSPLVNRVWLLTLLLRAGSWMKASRVSDPLPSPTSLLLPLYQQTSFFFSSFERGLQPSHNVLNLSNRQKNCGFKHFQVESWTSISVFLGSAYFFVTFHHLAVFLCS